MSEHDDDYTTTTTTVIYIAPDAAGVVLIAALGALICLGVAIAAWLTKPMFVGFIFFAGFVVLALAAGLYVFLDRRYE